MNPRDATYLVRLSELAADDVRRRNVGCVVRRLIRLRERGVSIADAWVIPSRVFSQVVAASVDPLVEPDAVLGDIAHPDGPRRAAEAAQSMRGAAIPAGLRRELSRLVDSAARVVVLPSPTLKDEALVQAASLDVVEGPCSDASALEEAVRAVWALAFDEHAVRRLRHERVRELGMAVVVARIAARAELARVQRSRHAVRRGALCVEPLSSGRLVSLPPITGYEPDGSSVRLVRAQRGVRLAPDSSGVPMKALSELVPRIDGADGPRLGIVALDGERIEVLSAHPVSSSLVPDGGDDETIWSRVSIGDSLLDVPSPLSRSLYDAFAAVAARPTSALFGARIARATAVLGDVNGCLYLNHSLFESIARRGVAQDARSIADFAGDARAIGGDPSLLGLSVAFTRVLALEQSLALEAVPVERDADAYFRWLSEMDLGILPDDGLTTTLFEARHHLFTAWQLRIAAIGALSAACHVARRLLERRVGTDALRVARMLGDTASEFPTSDFGRAWHHVAEIVGSEPSARQAIVDGAAATTALPEGASRRALASFLSAYADHGPCTGELGIARWREDERSLFALLRSALVGSLVDLDASTARGRSARDEDVDAALGRLSFFERRMLNAALPRLRRLAVLADRAHRLSVRAAGALRLVLLDADRRLLRGEPTLDSGTAFLLAFDELCSLLDGPTHTLGSLARERRAAWHRMTSRARPASRFSGDAVQEPPLESEPLHGIGSGRGVASGRARRVVPWEPASIGAVESGDVVVAESLDQALLPLVFTASAVVVSRGSAWTSGLPLARELGVPVVVAVGDGLGGLHDGHLLHVDAAAGTVRVR